MPKAKTEKLSPKERVKQDITNLGKKARQLGSELKQTLGALKYANDLLKNLEEDK